MSADFGNFHVDNDDKITYHLEDAHHAEELVSMLEHAARPLGSSSTIDKGWAADRDDLYLALDYINRSIEE